MRTALYTRVSSHDQNCQMQLQELRSYAQSRGWQVVKEYKDEGWSGTRTDRPAFKTLMAEAGVREFDVVLCWKLDRFGRSLAHCLDAIEQLKAAGVRFLAITQGLDTDQSNPAAKFQLQVLGAAAEFERELIRERSLAGTMRYRQDFEAGKIGGERSSRSGKNLAIGRPKRVFDREEVSKLRSEGLNLRQIASKLGVGMGTISRVLNRRSKN